MTDNLLIDFTPALKDEARIITRRYVHGMLYTPQSLWKEGETYGTLQLPGINGGANWSGEWARILKRSMSTSRRAAASR